MKVAELIALLKKQPAEIEVVVQSYEEGYDPVTDINMIPVAPVVDKRWYIGVYDDDAHCDNQVLFIRSRWNRAESDEL